MFPSINTALVIVLLGAPGSGKGTQAKRLAAEYRIPHISTGDIFRENMARDTLLGKKAKGFIQAGQLVPDEVVLDMLADRIAMSDCARGYLLDGFPRTIAQAEALNTYIHPRTSLNVLCLEVLDDVIVKRAEGRLVCRACGAIYSRDILPPLHAGICDKCGGEVYQRADDAAPVVRERLKVYHSQTQPLIDYYAKKEVLACFNGDQPPDVVYAALKKSIDQLFLVKSNPKN